MARYTEIKFDKCFRASTSKSMVANTGIYVEGDKEFLSIEAFCSQAYIEIPYNKIDDLIEVLKQVQYEGVLKQLD